MDRITFLIVGDSMNNNCLSGKDAAEDLQPSALSVIKPVWKYPHKVTAAKPPIFYVPKTMLGIIHNLDGEPNGKLGKGRG